MTSPPQLLRSTGAWFASSTECDSRGSAPNDAISALPHTSRHARCAMLGLGLEVMRGPERMSTPREVSAWLLMTVGDNRQHGGNAGYDDQADVYYTWDSTVPNHAQIKLGDPVALWDKDRLLGLSVIEEIETERKRKLLFKCPRCSRAGIKARKNRSPGFKCYKCGHEFDQPETRTTTVMEYRSRHDAAWTSLEGLLPGNDLRQLCESPTSQLSMRPLRWNAFQDAAVSKGAIRAVDRVVQRAPDFAFPQGHILEIVRVRRGQRQFREHLLGAQGETCAFTGDAPARVLEAGHL